MTKNREETQLDLLKSQSQTDEGHTSTDDSSGALGESGLYPRRNRTYSQWYPSEDGVTLAWNDLSVYINFKRKGKSMCKRIINGVTGAVKAGSLVALMGSSGSGKSTLMAALAHRNSGDTSVEGDILINGRPISNYMKYLSAFMHQEDIFVGSLTVLEHMSIMARLKLDRRTTMVERNIKIHEILRDLGLIKCLNTRIGSGSEDKTLSGGEKKRLAFATELLMDPPLMFCDEPTTGLDSFSAQKLISMMNTMASGGKTILCSIHQPSSDIFAMFSQLILLAEGRIAFIGSAANALDFFDRIGYKCPSNYNPGDFFIKTLASAPGLEDSSKQSIKRICDYFAVSDYYKEIDVVVQYEFHMGRAIEHKVYKLRNNFKECFFWTKIYWLTNRWFLEILRNPDIQALRLLQKMVIAVMVGLCYLGTDLQTQAGIQSIEGAIFLLVAENSFTPMYSVLDEFPKNYPLFLREYKSGLYSSITYYLSRLLSMLPGLILEPILFVLIVYWLSGLNETFYAFFITALATILTMNVATACGVFFSIAFDSAPNALAYLVPFDYILMVTSGLFIKLSTLPATISWLKFLSWLMYSTETMSIVQWQGIDNITCEVADPEIPCLTNGTQVLQKYSFFEGNLAPDLVGLVILYFGFYILGFLCFWWRATKK